MNNETKKWYSSTTLQGQIIIALSLSTQLIQAVWGFSLIGSEELTTGVAAVFTLIGIVMGVVGRIKANTKLV